MGVATATATVVADVALNATEIDLVRTLKLQMATKMMVTEILTKGMSTKITNKKGTGIIEEEIIETTQLQPSQEPPVLFATLLQNTVLQIVGAFTYSSTNNHIIMIIIEIIIV